MKKKIHSIMNRFRYWILPKKDCNSCCLSCPFYDECKGDHERINNVKKNNINRREQVLDNLL